MKKYFVAVLSFFVLAAHAQKIVFKKKLPVKKTKVSLLKNLNDSASYAIGINVANFYSQQGMKNMKASLVAKAINDVYAKKKTLISETEANDVVMGLMNKTQMDKVKPTIEAGEKFLAKNKTNPSIKTTPSGLQYEVLTEGTGAKPGATDTVTVNYKGTLLDGTEFDNSYKRGEPATFPLNRVIPGWTEGVQLMTIGSKYKFYIPYQLAYGINGTGPIPGGSVLIFEIELLSINGKK